MLSVSLNKTFPSFLPNDGLMGHLTGETAYRTVHSGLIKKHCYSIAFQHDDFLNATAIVTEDEI